MASRKKSARKDSSLCGNLGSDDGVDPRKFFDRETNQRRPDRKAQQLCGQVARTLSYVLSGESGDEILSRLDVVSVLPAPDTSQLLVTVALCVGSEPASREEILRRLNAAQGRLRAEVASAITRKRAPRLLFQVGVFSDELPTGGAP